MDEYQDLWDKTLVILEKNYSEEIFQDIFLPSKNVVRFLNGSIYVLVPTLYIKAKINKIYISKINDILKKLTKDNVKFKFVVSEDIEDIQPLKPAIVDERLGENNLNEHYNFESFVVGESNMFAYRFAMNVADQPGMIANPLYIFGGVGLGKTHLMQAIGNYILDKDLNTRILYVQANEFIADYIKATQSNNMNNFEKKYNNLDVLLVDDIQMLDMGKKSQQEFFKLFNDMYSRKKQIVITSDRPAADLEGIMDRLTSRFSCGMTVDIKLPTLSQRINILKRKASETTPKTIPDDVLEFIAQNYTDNIRELEGALNRVIYYGEIFGIDIDLDKAKEALEPLLKARKNSINNSNNYDNVLSVVANFYSISVADIISNSRNSRFVLPRHICMFILKKRFDLPYKQIGMILGGRDHTTVMSGYNKINDEINSNSEMKMAIDSIMKKVE